MCEKCANDETEYDSMHLRRYDKRILLEELCPGNLSPFCFTIFSHSSKIQQINELFLFVSCKMKESGTPKKISGMAYKPRGPPEVDKNRPKPRRVGLCEKYHRFL